MQLSEIQVRIRPPRIRFAVLALAALVMAPLAQASALAESVVRLSPLGGIAEQSRAMLKSGIREGLAGTGQVEPFVAETIAGIGSSAFSGQRMRARLVNDLNEDLSTEQLGAVEAWYQSDLGQRIAKAETEAAMPASWETVRENGPALRERFDGSRREALFDRYDQASRASETTVETAMAAQLSLAEALASLSTKETAESVTAQIQENRPAIERQAREQVYLAYRYMYESLSEGELERYLQFLESAAGQAFASSAGNSIHNAIMEPVSSVGGQLVRLLGPGDR